MLTTSESYRQRFFRDICYYETFHPLNSEMIFTDRELKENIGLQTRISATKNSDKIVSVNVFHLIIYSLYFQFILLTVPLEINKSHLLIPPNLSITLDLQFHPKRYIINAPEKIVRGTGDANTAPSDFKPTYYITNIQLICDKYVLRHELQTKYLRTITAGAHPRYFFERDTVIGPFAIPQGRQEFSINVGKTKYPQAISVIFMDRRSIQGSYKHSPQVFYNLSTTDCHVLYGGIR